MGQRALLLPAGHACLVPWRLLPFQHDDLLVHKSGAALPRASPNTLGLFLFFIYHYNLVHWMRLRVSALQVAGGSAGSQPSTPQNGHLARSRTFIPNEFYNRTIEVSCIGKKARKSSSGWVEEEI